MTIGVLNHEITAPVRLRLDSGAVNPAAIGFSRASLHHSGGGADAQSRRGEYWLLTSPTHVIQLATDQDRRGVQQRLWALDRATGTRVEIFSTRSRATTGTLPSEPESGPIRVHSLRLDISIDEVPGGTRVRVYGERVQIDVRVGRAPARDGQAGSLATHDDRLGTVIAHDDRSFDYTLSDLARPVSGRVAIDGVWGTLDPTTAWALHDFSRGCRRSGPALVRGGVVGITTAEGSGATHRLGLRFGAGLGILVDGSLAFDPAGVSIEALPEGRTRVYAAGADLTFTPFENAAPADTPATGPASASGHHRVGNFTGWVDSGHGRLSVQALTGWLTLIDA
ncbi:DUF2804 family protein [Mycetocola tolaasinivorans]|uniref:DUF2804 family protein n=1 Tax=Mycetocola tolaasinivorans TaxID=76635 RepID=A0A3L6ZXM9_9MICO|nr:DUF2804 family protein [Mycetocola tolaasinivorans]RLP72677.1 DUF2804 family protein [Mycetocola tolaasinivorans]